jgi:hypothetical protein
MDQTINIFLRGVAKIKTTNFELEEGRIDIDGLILTYKTSDVTILHNTNLTISFNVNFFILQNRAFLIMFICLIILGLYAILKSRGPKEEAEEIATERAIPVRELRQFVIFYEEKNAIQLDLEKSDDDLIHRRIQKKIYNKTVKTYSDKIKQINDDIRPFKKILMESAEKIQKVIQQLDYLEAERISVKDSVALLEDRYRKGKLPSRAAYEKLSDEMIKRIDELQKKIDRNLNDLRAYLI